MTHLLQRRWAVDVYQVFFWLRMWASFLVPGYPAIHRDSWWWAGHSQSWQKDQLSSYSLALKVWAHGLSTDNWELTEVFWISSDRYIKRYHCIRCAGAAIYSTSVSWIECHRGGYRGGCVQEQWVGGWVEDHQGVQLHSFPSGLFLLLPSSLGFLAFCWFYKLPAFLSINSSHYALIIHSWFLLLTTRISGW